MIDVVLPVLDEREAIPWVLDRIPSGMAPIVVDNGSIDGSGELARSLGARVVMERTRGFGAACYAGLKASTTDTVCFMDCDGSLDPVHLRAVAEPVESGAAGLVIGAREPDRGAWPLHARIANAYLARRVRRMTGIHLSDLGPMRAARREELLALELQDRRSGWPLEMVLKAAQAGWTISEVKVPYLRRTGRSKVTGTVGGTFRAVSDMSRFLG